MLRSTPLFALLIATSLTFAADQKPQPSYLRFEGVDGALLLCGDRVPEAARTRFLDLAGKNAEVVLLVRDEKATWNRAEDLGKGLEQKEAKVRFFHSDPKDVKITEALRTAKGAWLIGADN